MLDHQDRTDLTRVIQGLEIAAKEVVDIYVRGMMKDCRDTVLAVLNRHPETKHIDPQAEAEREMASTEEGQ